MATKVGKRKLTAAQRDQIKNFRGQTEALKEQGKAMFKNGNYVGAIQTYQKGFVMCNEYFTMMDSDLPMRCDFTGAEQDNKNDQTLWL